METLEKKTLREKREEAGLTQRGLANKAGVSPMAVHYLEKGVKPLDSENGRKVLGALGLGLAEVVRVKNVVEVDPDFWPNDGLVLDAPRQPLKWWRERRGLTQTDLAATAHVGISTIKEIEQERSGKISPPNRRRLARALKVAPDKIAYPGDGGTVSGEIPREQILRNENRVLRRTLRRWSDAANDGRYLTNRGQDDLAPLIEDTERELRGT